MQKITESIKELREICQSSRRKCDTWYGKNVCRKFSIYLTFLALSYGVTANSITLIFLLIGISSGLFFMLGTDFGIISGVIALQLWYLIDHVDGEVARYRKEVSLTGVYFDKVSHYIVSPLVFFTLGWGIYKDTGLILAVFCGFLAGINTILITVLEDVKDSIILQKAKFESFNIVFDKVDILKPVKSEEKNILKRLFSIIHEVCTFPTAMNLISIAVFVKIIFFKLFLNWYLSGYVIVSTIVFMGRFIVLVNNKTIDNEYQKMVKK